MSSFEDLKKQAEVRVKTDEEIMKGWVKANRLWLAAIGLAGIIGFIVAKVV